MFVCDRVVTYFDVEKTLGTRSYQVWNKDFALSSPKPAIYDYMGLTGFGLGLIVVHGVSPKDSLMANWNKLTEKFLWGCAAHSLKEGLNGV